MTDSKKLNFAMVVEAVRQQSVDTVENPEKIKNGDGNDEDFGGNFFKDFYYSQVFI